MEDSIYISDSDDPADEREVCERQQASIWERPYARFIAGCNLAILIPFIAMISGFFAPNGLLVLNYKLLVGVSFLGVLLACPLIFAKTVPFRRK